MMDDPPGRALRRRPDVNYGGDGDDSNGESNDSPYAPEPDDEPSLFVSQDEGSAAEEIDANGEHEPEDGGKPANRRKTTGRSRTTRARQPATQPRNNAGQNPIQEEDNYAYRLGYDDSLPPMSTIREWFGDLTAKAHSQGFSNATDWLNGRSLKVATMCSGTESPILALNQIAYHLGLQFNIKFSIDHVFSAEIEPYKQAFIERNFRPPIIFADITQLSSPPADESKPRTATTIYGSEAEVPGGLDLLVAGFVCRDFSVLNNAPKKLDDRGESGDTFYAIKAYVEEFKPKIVILENVMGIPWDKAKAKALNKKRREGKKNGAENEGEALNGEDEAPENEEGAPEGEGGASKSSKMSRGLDEHFEDVGYASHHIVVDTKDYYVPHTRMRVYLVAIHKDSLADPDDLETLFKTWEKVVKAMERPASVPAEMFLLKSDDPKLKHCQFDESDRSKPTKWDKCKAGHYDYRDALGLGLKRPVTNWVPGGGRLLPDHHKLTFKGLTERVLDSIDIAHLRNIKRGFDDIFWNRIPELSQNVYRIQDTTKSGIVQCLTPSGLPYSTARAGIITGLETLWLQALDADALDVSNLTSANLRDLAGNAMTSTVVGAVMVAALKTFHMVLPPGMGNYPAGEEEGLAELGNADKLRQIPDATERHPAAYIKLSVTRALELANCSRRLCYCEGRTDVTAKPIQQCTFCRHTTCITCGKNPKHHYINMESDFLLKRRHPYEFENSIKESIPMLINFHFAEDPSSPDSYFRRLEGYQPQDLGEDTWSAIIETIRHALSSEVYFREVIRSHRWHVHFSSPKVEGMPGARVELMITEKSVEWLLYAIPGSSTPLKSGVHKFLDKFPCARMIPTGDDITQGTWELFVPDVYEAKALVTGAGKRVPSYKAKIGLVHPDDGKIWTKYSLELLNGDADKFERDINGEYEYSELCGQAYSSLHVQVSSKASDNPLFLFFDHEKTLRNPNLDSFVFTDDIRRLDYGDHRRTFGRVAPDDDDQLEIPSYPAFLDGFLNERSITIYRDGYWVKCPELLTNQSDRFKAVYLQLPKEVTYLGDRLCNSKDVVLNCEAEFPGQISTFWIRNKWSEVPKSMELQFFEEFRWVLERGLEIDGHRQNNTDWNPTRKGNELCFTCAPLAPVMRWAYSVAGGTKKRAVIPKQAPFEDKESARNYEIALKARPSPLAVRYRIDNDNVIGIHIGFNPTTLVHRAWGRLALTGDTDNIETAWRLVTDDNKSSKPAFFRFKLMDSMAELPAQQPSRMQSYQLRHDQLQNLTWMINQELNIKPFIEEEIVEERLPYADYKLEAKATRQVFMAGGVLAHDVGFGKTVSILSLIDSLSSLDAQRAMIKVRGRLSVGTSAVFCPPHLVSQWASEAKKFWGEGYQILPIANVAKLKKLAIKDLRKAHIVIVNWNLVKNDEYTLCVAQLAGMIEPDSNASARAFRAWYEKVLSNLDRNVEELKARPETFATYLREEFQKNKKDTQLEEPYIPMKRPSGAAYQKATKAAETKALNKKERISALEKMVADVQFKPLDSFNVSGLSDDRELGDFGCPIFEILQFNRVVIDEYTYLDKSRDLKDVCVILKSLKAHSKWVLSGTPPLGGFSDIKSMAKFIGIDLGINDYSLMKSDVLNSEIKDMTNSEKFQRYSQNSSPAWQEHRHYHAQDFLNHFVRKDTVDMAQFPKVDTFRLIDQSAAMRAVYHELVGYLDNHDFDISNDNMATNSHKSKLIHDALSQGEDAEEALILLAAIGGCGLSTEPHQATDVYRLYRRRKLDCRQTAAWIEHEYASALSVHDGENDQFGFFLKFALRVFNNGFGDLETSLYVENIMVQVQQRAGHVSNNSPPMTEDARALRAIATNLGILVDRLVDLKRSQRFARSIMAIQDSPTNKDHLECSKCHINKSLDKMTLLGRCGHLVCDSCLSMDGEDCTEGSCLAIAYYRDKMPVARFLHGDNALTHDSLKIPELLKLVNNIIAAKEKVIVFVQFQKLLKKVQEALQGADIRFARLDNHSECSTAIADFANDPSLGVMILNIGDSSAAGSNLTAANHIVFVAPYHVKGSNSQYDYESAIDQAVGRARRYGQKKTVFVYEMLVKHTVDIDILEFRKAQVIKQEASGDIILASGKREESKFGTMVYDYIKRQNN